MDHFTHLAGRIAAYPDRLRAALVPFALTCTGVLELRGWARRRARVRNRAVAMKLALLADAEATARLRERLGGLRALLAWERRAARRVDHMSWRARQSAFRAAIHGKPRVGKPGVVAKACSGEEPCGRTECEDVFCRLLREARGGDPMDRTDGVGRADERGEELDEKLHFALPSLPCVPGLGHVRPTEGRSHGRERSRRVRVVRVWPCELMSAAENAREAGRRERRLQTLAARRSHVEAGVREARARCLQELDNAAKGIRRGHPLWVAQRRAEDEARLARLRERDAAGGEARAHGRSPDD